MREAYTSPLKKSFIAKYHRNTKLLSANAFDLIIVFSQTLVWSEVDYMRDEYTNLPLKDKSGDALAEITQMGNVTRNMSLWMIADRMYLSRESEKTIRNAIREAKSLALIRNIPPDKNEEAKIKKGPGHPPKVEKFEIHPDVAWCGYGEHGICYSNSLEHFNDLV